MKQTIGKGTSIGWIGCLAIRAVERGFSGAIGSPFLNGQSLGLAGLSNQCWERSVPGFLRGTFLKMGVLVGRRRLQWIWLKLLVAKQLAARCSPLSAPPLAPN